MERSIRSRAGGSLQTTRLHIIYLMHKLSCSPILCILYFSDAYVRGEEGPVQTEQRYVSSNVFGSFLWRPVEAALLLDMYILHFRSIFLHFVQTNNLAGGAHTQALPYYSIHGNYRKGIGSGYCSALIFNDLLQLGPLISITGIIKPAEAESNNTTRCSAQLGVFYHAAAEWIMFYLHFFFLV